MFSFGALEVLLRLSVLLFATLLEIVVTLGRHGFSAVEGKARGRDRGPLKLAAAIRSEAFNHRRGQQISYNSRMLRRLVAVLTWMLMAHLTIVGSDVACASHSGDVAAMSHAMSHHQHAMPRSEQARMDDAPRGTPATPMCCQALSSCTAVMAVTQARPLGYGGTDRRVILRSGSDMQLSEILAPDPPPPRA